MKQTGRRTALAVLPALLILIGAVVAAKGQEEAGVSGESLEQALVDLDALIIATQVTTRCALYDGSISYLSPLTDMAARIRIDELQALLAPQTADLPEQMAGMREEANTVPCGNDGLAPFFDFARQVGADVTAIALRTWAAIDIGPCAYFADDGFLDAAARAEAAAVDIEADPDPSREAYLSQIASAWIGLFERNCNNPTFDPTVTLPGRIALALPYEPA